ncbi:MAG: hypothetical protein HDS24_03260 [Bacteroides sp.]|nr:hypothetical protein [Bacteroides sp.]
MDLNKDILKALYEVEGLVALSGLRPEKESELLDSALDKLTEIYEDIKALKEREMSAEADESAEESVAAPIKPAVTPEEQAPSWPDEDDDDCEYCLPDDEEEEMEITKEVKRAPSSESVQPAGTESSNHVIPRPIFCLNDRFRFCRTLFGGSSKDFNAALEKISLMSSPEEAADYFYQAGFDPEDPEVAAFMDIVLKSFG